MMFTRLSHTIKTLIYRRRGFAKFLSVGSLNTLVDLLLFSLFANLLGIHIAIASVASTGLTLILSFYLNHKFVFRSQKRKRSVALQFIAITLFNVWVVQTAVIVSIVHLLEMISYFHDHVWTMNTIAKLGGVCVSFILNFICYRALFRGIADDQKKED